MTHDSGSGDANIGFLLPISESPTLEETVEYAVREAREIAAGTDGRATLYLATPAVTWAESGAPTADSSDALLSRTLSTAESVLESLDSNDVAVDGAVLGQERHPADPIQYVDSLIEYAADRDVRTAFLDPSHRIPFETTILPSLEEELRNVEFLDVEVAPVERPARRQRLVTRGGIAHFATLFGISFGFYLVIGGFAEPLFDVATGLVSALVVAAVLSRISFEVTPGLGKLAVVARWLLYVPYLLWEIAVANLAIAYVVLHPSLPIDPSVQRFRPGVWSGTATATLANSITLTPGTLTVDVTDGEFVVHSLTENARKELLDGSLERAVRFVFYGRDAIRYASPRERLGLDEGDST